MSIMYQKMTGSEQSAVKYEYASWGAAANSEATICLSGPKIPGAEIALLEKEKIIGQRHLSLQSICLD